MLGSKSERQVVSTLLLILILINTGLHLWRLPDIPPGFWYDEAFNAMDAAWMIQSGSPQIFLMGNNGREVMFHYLAGILVSLLGNTPYVFRLTSALVSLLAIPLIYKWVLALFAGNRNRYWLGLFAALGLSFSTWYLVMSRAGYRAILLPFFVMLTSYLFYRGWQKNSKWLFAAAGVALGASQYTYLAARFLPLIFGLFGILWVVLLSTQRGEMSSHFAARWPGIRRLWGGLAITALVSAIVFLPLAIFFWQNPTALFSRTSDIVVFQFLEEYGISFSSYMLEAMSVFWGKSDPAWRHGFVGLSPFSWLSLVAFWVGMVIAVLNIRKPAYLLLLVTLGVMWFPAVLSIPPVNALQLSGILPPFYTLMAIGLVIPLGWGSRQIAQRWSPLAIKMAVAVIFTITNGTFVTQRYFVAWANEPRVYEQFEAGKVDLINDLLSQTDQVDVIIPFNFYSKPAVRYALYNQFEEQEHPPELTTSRPAVLMVEPNQASDSFVWLTRWENELGSAYLSATIPQEALKAVAETYPTIDSDANATLISLPDLHPIADWFTDPAPRYRVDFAWSDQIQLAGYEVSPRSIQPGRPVTLHLYWLPQTAQPPGYSVFVQLIDSQGQPITQLEIPMEEHFYWRQNRLTPEQYSVWTGPQTKPGPYLFRVGIFDPISGERLPIYDEKGALVGDQTVLGLFYVNDSQANFTIPDQALQAGLGEKLTFLGYSLGELASDRTTLPVRLYWRAQAPPEIDYTAFLQLLDAQNQLVAGWDSQPLNGLYPTSNWKPGEVVADTFTLSLPPNLPPGSYRLVTGMYNLDTGERLPAVGADGRPLPGDMIVLRQIIAGS